jgi:hypothetical protein
MVGLAEPLAGERRFDAATIVAFRSAKERFSPTTGGDVGSPILTHECHLSLAPPVAEVTISEREGDCRTQVAAQRD